MNKTLKKVISVIMAMIFALSCASVAFAASEYPRYCSECGDLIEDQAEASVHSLVSCKNKTCEICGEKFTTVLFAVHRITCGYELKIKNNPGESTLNYGDTLRLSADVFYLDEKLDDREIGVEYVWTVDGGAAKITSYGNACEVEAVKTGTVTITVTLVDAEGEVIPGGIDENSEKYGFIDYQTINVKAGFFQKFISFFKDLFGMNRIIVQ